MHAFISLVTIGGIGETFLRPRHGTPTHDTYNRVFQALEPEKFGEVLACGMQCVRPLLGGEVADLNGKAVRPTLNKGHDPRLIGSAWANESGLLLGQHKVRNKSNEITALPELLRVLELAGPIVTAVALHCQKDIAKEIIEADADYVLALKGNQGTAFTEVKTFLDAAIQRGERHLVFARTTDKGHGRVKLRRSWQTENIGWFATWAPWAGLRTVGCWKRSAGFHGKESVQRRYYLSSLKADAPRFGRAVWDYWSVENGLHWVLDVVLGRISPVPVPAMPWKTWQLHGGWRSICCAGTGPGDTVSMAKHPNRHRPRLPTTHPPQLTNISTGSHPHTGRLDRRSFRDVILDAPDT